MMTIGLDTLVSWSGLTASMPSSAWCPGLGYDYCIRSMWMVVAPASSPNPFVNLARPIDPEGVARSRS
jgi:hypothetical protein